MFCHNCGKEIPDISNYCLFCGTKIKQDTDDMSLAYPSTEKEILYETVMKERVIKKLKCPATSSWPKFDESMIKKVGTFTDYTVIETYIDAENGFGAKVRVNVRIKIDDDLHYLGFAFKEWNSVKYSMYHK